MWKVIRQMIFIGCHWVSTSKPDPWKFLFYLKEIKALSSLMQVPFVNVGQSANGMANSLAKLGLRDLFHLKKKKKKTYGEKVAFTYVV